MRSQLSLSCYTRPIPRVPAERPLRQPFLDSIRSGTLCAANPLSKNSARKSSREPCAKIEFTKGCKDNADGKQVGRPAVPDPARPIGHPIVVRLCQTAVKKSIRVIRVICSFPNFPRNARPNLTEYLSERPEMTSHGRKPRKAKTMKENNTYENKIS